VIEPTVQPLYHGLNFVAAAPAQLRFFQGTAGLNELLASPGLVTGGQLPNPKIFVVYGIRVHYSEHVQNDAITADLKVLLYNCWGRLFVGVKDYLVVPLFYLPSGLGISSSGFDATGVTTNVAATSGVPTFFNRMSIQKRRITLPPQQAFFFEINPVNIAATHLHQNRLMWVFFDGEFGREVM
jgi:hypothetical protein